MTNQEIFEGIKDFLKEQYNHEVKIESVEDDAVYSQYASDMGVDCVYTLVMDLAEKFGAEECVDGDELCENATLMEMIQFVRDARAQNSAFAAYSA
ncbi:hypothetical protein [Vibrio crassostreae]|uniref:hypothetical protein n=1 Tax=Vibrio crassostreae TaxID=246167 RepID=UPI001B311711|nr:hypothetical protein [Vibrio crassostreae]